MWVRVASLLGGCRGHNWQERWYVSVTEQAAQGGIVVRGEDVVGRWDGVRRRSGGEGTDIITVRKLLESQSDEDVI